eukprot:GHVL01015079.1.p1 GENE.GHVL01015079.1~~GHVL01015079.1.p1  ORF type:complete len:126 (-),score=21.27 GHVL01015079.1:84-461(-)
MTLGGVMPTPGQGLPAAMTATRPFAINQSSQEDSTHEWTEHMSQDGRKYYHNSNSGKSSWDKPDELKSPEERANFTHWKEYQTADGRTYYFNGQSKQSVWQMPRELRKLKGLPVNLIINNIYMLI